MYTGINFCLPAPQPSDIYGEGGGGDPKNLNFSHICILMRSM